MTEREKALAAAMERIIKVRHEMAQHGFRTSPALSYAITEGKRALATEEPKP